jgi:hypothetical protein
MKNLFKWTGLFESNLSAIEWGWRLFTLALVSGGGTTAALMARGNVFLRNLGILSWLLIGLLTSYAIAILLYLIKLGNRQTAEAAYLAALSSPKGSVNPMLENFVDQVIYLPDLYLPRLQVHENKQFKRCKLVGPGAIAIIGGTYKSTSFIEAGSIVVLPNDTKLVGVLVLKNCTVENCEIIGITILVDKNSAQAFTRMGAHVVGV